jgi:hypothetical protein
MQRLDLDVDRATAESRCTDVTFRTPPNWTIVLFLAGLASLHWYMAISALMKGRFDAFMSLVLGPAFTIGSLVIWRLAKEITFMPAARRVRIRSGLRRLYYQRFVRFSDIRSVRLTLLHPHDPKAAIVELILDREAIEFPPTDVPRQEALALAMTLNVPLMKVYSDSYGPVAERLDQLPPE